MSGKPLILFRQSENDLLNVFGNGGSDRVARPKARAGRPGLEVMGLQESARICTGCRWS